MLMYLFCLLLMIAAPTGYLVLNILRSKGKISTNKILIVLLCLLAGIALPVLATYLDIKNLPEGTICAMPSVGFAFLGIAITITIIPFMAVVFFVIGLYRKN